MLKSGTVWKVMWVIMPRLPSDKRAARKRSGFFCGEQVTNWELDRRIVREVMFCERRPCDRDEP